MKAESARPLAVIWDIDGTLLNTKGGIVAAYRHTLEKYGITCPDDEYLAGLIGPTPQEIFKTRFAISEERAQLYTAEFREHYRTEQLGNAVAYPGIVDVLSAFEKQNMVQFVVTNKRQDYAEEILDIFNLKKFFYRVYGTDASSSRSKAQLLGACIADNSIASECAVFIGDTTGDMNAALKNGLKFIGVNYGFGFSEVKGYAEEPADIIRLLGL